jgi:hypothetical protein
VAFTKISLAQEIVAGEHKMIVHARKIKLRLAQVRGAIDEFLIGRVG